VIPALKWQVSPLPGKFDICIMAGAALPSPTVRFSNESTFLI
jgi:hypothetical protein